MTDEAYLNNVEEIISIVFGFKQRMNQIREDWFEKTGYACPFRVVGINSAFGNVLKELELERLSIAEYLHASADSLGEIQVKSEVM